MRRMILEGIVRNHWKKWMPAILVVILVLFILAADWKAMVSWAVETHQAWLEETDQNVDQMMSSIKAMFSQKEMESEKKLIYEIYENFSDELKKAESYRASGIHRVRDEEGDREYEFSVTFGPSGNGLRLTQGNSAIREVWKEGTLYQIDETNGTVFQTAAEEPGTDDLKQATSGRVILEEGGISEGRKRLAYEIYQGGAIYRMIFDGNGRLQSLVSFADGIRTEYEYKELQLGTEDETLLDVTLEGYEQVSGIEALRPAAEPDGALSLPPEYPSAELPFPAYYELSSIKANLDQQGKGEIMVTYFSSYSMEELKNHYVGLLQGTNGYVISEDIKDGEQTVTVCGTAGSWTAESVTIRYDSSKGLTKTVMYLTK